MARSSSALCVVASLALMMAMPTIVNAALPPDSPVVAWINVLQQHLRDTKLQNQVGSKYYALLSLSVYNAVKVNRGASGKNPSNKPQFNETAVVSYASHTLLTHYFPWWFYKHDLLIKSLIGDLDAYNLAGAKQIGENEANKVIASRVGDGYARWANFIPAPYNTTGSIGQYQFTPGQTYGLYPQYGASKPLALSFSDVDVIVTKYKNKAKGYFQSDEYYRDLNETYTVGGINSTRNAFDQKTPAFWAGGPGTSLIHGQFINASVSLLPSTYNLYQQARFFAYLGVSINDASQACYKTKYEVLAWRPVTATQLGDGRGRYTPDPTWLPLLVTPPHPSYPSGHQCLSQPAVDVLAQELGITLDTPLKFQIASEAFPDDPPRTYTRLSQIIDETTASRVLGGVHFKRDNDDGLLLGADATKLVYLRL